MTICYNINQILTHCIGLVYCGHDNPVWSCKNAMNNAKHPCKFALCSHCYFNRNDRSQGKRRRLTMIRSKDSCCHRNLEINTQGEYFNPEYVNRRLKKGDIFPTVCAVCQRTFSNNKITAAC